MFLNLMLLWSSSNLVSPCLFLESRKIVCFLGRQTDRQAGVGMHRGKKWLKYIPFSFPFLKMSLPMRLSLDCTVKPSLSFFNLNLAGHTFVYFCLFICITLWFTLAPVSPTFPSHRRHLSCALLLPSYRHHIHTYTHTHTHTNAEAAYRGP